MQDIVKLTRWASFTTPIIQNGLKPEGQIFLKSSASDTQKLKKKGILLPLIDLKCSFRSPARYEDEILVRTKPVEMSCVRLSFSYEVFKKDEMSLLASGETSHAWTDKSLKPLNLEKKMPELYALLKEAVNNR